MSNLFLSVCPESAGAKRGPCVNSSTLFAITGEWDSERNPGKTVAGKRA
jgi:hypothetical protein